MMGTSELSVKRSLKPHAFLLAPKAAYAGVRSWACGPLFNGAALTQPLSLGMGLGPERTPGSEVGLPR